MGLEWEWKSVWRTESQKTEQRFPAGAHTLENILIISQHETGLIIVLQLNQVENNMI